MRRDYTGGAGPAALTSALGGSTADLTIICDDLTGYPDGTGDKPFFVVIDRGTASEEKILCSTRSGNTIAVYNDGIDVGRAEDDTSITSHAVNAVIEHVFTATDADEANLHVNTTTFHWTICTSTTQPASPTANTVILETDTLRVKAYIDSDWQEITSDNEGGLSPLLLMGG